MRTSLRPFDGGDHPIGQQRNVESELPRQGVGLLFFPREEVEQQRRELCVHQHVGHRAIAATVPAAAATVSKHDEAARVAGNAQVAVEDRAVRIEADRQRTDGFGWRGHE